jgi:hypothetical protein
MDLTELRPFAKIAAVVVGIVVVGVIAKCSMGSSSPSAACNDLPMDRINPCIAHVRACSGTEDEVKACIAKAIQDPK